ncbi:hypothetical protein BBO99_00007444 [Phytophthora kernoviae]|uniref:COMM domain-containing protein n=2 Tax=Phytophthora kernoviae TaxID=325452 RepID=A0A3R7KRD2_9STRA|nr:hypothetical protein G195_008311 [Phytophthora kernoviae 00238/432]KAG2519563.1 hypothetical protein JM16_007082 [Phytophthora kernoviae]KAG2520712.1 hypothetical protein JM18_006987 [Phytophthora kernoviae]RLN13912.1 hypothetical protein BBI17_007386 [Phytophthora kernoviae]RLN76565.1 hypothetical protein BBO99_00007444 [Phytophthora kernoviae]
MSRSFAADERVLEVVAQTTALSAENFGAACKLAVRVFGSEKQSKRRLTRTASSSGWETQQMEQAVLAIAKILMDAAKTELPEQAFRLALKGMEMLEDHVEVLTQLYAAHAEDIRACVTKETGTSIPHYRNLEWRIDLELGTRFLRNKPKPIVTLRLDTSTRPSSSSVPQVQSTCLRVDYDSLRLMQRQLETALKEVPRTPSWSLKELHQEGAKLDAADTVLTEDKLCELAELCHLHVEEEKLPELLKGVESIIQCTKTIQAMTLNENIDDVYAKNDYDAGVAPLREDVVTEGNYAEKVLANAAEKAGYFFKVPKVLQD